MRMDKGYILPDVVGGHELVCIKVYIPNDPRYIEAFSGQYHDLATWLPWDKDGTNRAAIAAAEWKDAVDFTYENGWLDSCGESCEVCEMTKDELIQSIMEVLDMNINVNCGGCGCGCGGTGNLPPSSYEPGLPPTGNVLDPATPNGAIWKCNMSHYLIYSMRITLLKAVEWSGIYDNWNASFKALFSFYTANITEFAYQPYASILALINGVPTASLITEVIDPAYDQLVCAISSAATSSQAAANLYDVLRSIFGDIVLRQLALEVASQLPYDIAFVPQDLSDLPITHQNRTCNCSESNYTLPEVPDGYELRPLNIFAVDLAQATEQSRTAVFNENLLSIVATAGDTQNAGSSGWAAKQYHTVDLSGTFLGVYIVLDASASHGEAGSILRNEYLFGNTNATAEYGAVNTSLAYEGLRYKAGLSGQDLTVAQSLNGTNVGVNPGDLNELWTTFDYYDQWPFTTVTVNVRSWYLFKV